MYTEYCLEALGGGLRGWDDMNIREIRKQLALATVLICASNLSSVAQADSSTISDDAGGAKSIVLHPPVAKPQSIKCASWLPNDKPKVAMLCIHGFSLHKGCYAEFGREMAKNGIATYAIDLRGFGELKSNAETSSMDFDGCLVDIKAALQFIRKEHPGVPVVILGESMGGAIALRACAFYPELISGLVAAVPARDRFGMSGDEAKVALKAGLSTLFGGYGKKMDNIALSAVQKISLNEELRSEWKNDPLMRTDFAPKEFVQFDEFMSKNLNAAAMIKDTPVLFLQGTNDKLIRPAGTWKLFERLNTSNRQLVLSKNSEHLIFEKGQFKPDDLKFVTTWIDRNVAPLGAVVIAGGKLPVVASKEEYATAKLPTDEEIEESRRKAQIAALPAAPAPSEFKSKIASSEGPQGINFWIELYRDGKTYRCNNKTQFKSGDSIRFHLIPANDGYAYLVMKAGTTGKSDVLFPNNDYGTQNHLKKGQDYPIPAVGWMQFDENPGTEQLGLVFATEKVDVTPESLRDRTLTAFVSPDNSGAKDLCPTRMKLSWDDPEPALIPDDFSAVAQVHKATDSSLVRLTSTSAGGMVSAAIELIHGK
jgi:alpha-beta hydrolase superfamily lysophospholipase